MKRNAWAMGVLCAVTCTGYRSVAGAQEDGGPRIATTTAGPQYKAGAFHRWILGRHYRDLWTTPLRVEVLDLEAMAGGLTPTRTGGGMQTRSLRFLGADGREYAFRSVDKDPSAVLDSLFHETIVDDLVQDGISAAHPFGALVAAPLLDAVGVLHVDPQLRVMPDDPALGEFREEFAGMLGLIEEFPDENEGDRTSFRGTERVISSERLVERLDGGPNDRVDAREYVRARITDVLLGDWDRHRGQWRWATFDTEAPRSWLPVPRDRDQAFSKFDGLATRIVGLYMPQFVRFEPEYPSMKRLHWNARVIDRWLLAELDREAWDEIGAEVQEAITDAVIERAAAQLPPEIYEINGEELQATLRARRDRLREAWSDFYELVSERVEIRATDEDEVVLVDRSTRGSVTVEITAPDDVEEPYFDRTFLVDETREIRLDLREGNDRVTIEGDAETDILLRVIGGEDDDHFEVEGRGAGIRFYDHEGENTVSGDDAPEVNDRPFEAWEWSPEDRNQPPEWGRSTFPIFWSSFSTDLGLFIGGGARFESYGFRKVPFSSAFDVRGGYSPSLRKGRVEVNGRFHNENSPVFWDVGARMSRLDVLHYYGLGNDSPSEGESFHEVDVTMAAGGLAIGVSPDPRLELSAGVTIERTSTLDNSGRFISGLGPIYGDGVFASVGFSGAIRYDPLADVETTGNRIRLDLHGAVYPKALDVEGTFGRLGGSVSVLLASSIWPAVSLALRAGGEQVRGSFPWHEAAFVGGAGTVRGWDEQRFAGDRSLFGGGELRLRLLRPRVVVPVGLGAFGFVDVGRVWLDGASPDGWHDGVGGGLYLQPVGHPYLVRIGAGRSNEATKVFVSMGLPY